eukprot:g36563.t1
MCLSRLSTKGFVDADSVEVHQLQRPLPGARQRCWRAATSSCWYIPLAASSPALQSPTLVHAYFMRVSCALLAGRGGSLGSGGADLGRNRRISRLLSNKGLVAPAAGATEKVLGEYVYRLQFP